MIPGGRANLLTQQAIYSYITGHNHPSYQGIPIVETTPFDESTKAYNEELRVIITMLVKPELAIIFLNNLDGKCFAEEPCAQIFKAAAGVYTEYQKVTKELIYSFLTSKLWWETLSGEGYSEKEWIRNVPGTRKILTRDELPGTIELLKEKKRRRDLYRIGVRLNAIAMNTSQALNTDKLVELKSSVKSSLENLDDGFEEKALLFSDETLFDSYKESANNRLTKDYVGLGIPSIDVHFIEGLAPPGITLIAGPTSAGKSAFIQNIALNHTTNNQPFLLFAPEPQLLRTIDRLVSIRYGIPLWKIKQAFRRSNLETHEAERKEILHYAQEISKLPLFIVEKRGLTLSTLFDIVRSVKKEIKDEYPDKDLIWGIDLFKNLIDASQANLLAQHISALMEKVEEEMAETHTHGILLVHFNRYYSHREGERPEVRDIEFGASYEQTAINIFFITRPFFKDATIETDEVATIWIEKQRDGRAKFKVKLKYDNTTQKMSDLEESEKVEKEIEKPTQKEEIPIEL